MEGILDRFAARGIPREAVVPRAVITPACGLGTLPEDAAERALRLTEELSDLLRGRYGGNPHDDDGGRRREGGGREDDLLRPAPAGLCPRGRPAAACRGRRSNANLHLLLSLPLPEGLGSLREEMLPATPGAVALTDRIAAQVQRRVSEGDAVDLVAMGGARGRGATAT